MIFSSIGFQEYIFFILTIYSHLTTPTNVPLSYIVKVPNPASTNSTAFLSAIMHAFTHYIFITSVLDPRDQIGASPCPLIPIIPITAMCGICCSADGRFASRSAWLNVLQTT